MASTLSRDVLSSQKRILPPRKEMGTFPVVTCGFFEAGEISSTRRERVHGPLCYKGNRYLFVDS